LNIRPMLAERWSEPTALKHMLSDEWWCEQKLDGNRIMVRVEDHNVTFYNRKGDRTQVTGPVAKLFGELSQGPWVFDGELCKERFHVFDLPIAGDVIKPNTPFETRRQALELAFEHWQPDERFINLVSTKKTPHDKLALYERAKSEGAEGVMFKDKTGVYLPGKRYSKMRKCKFVHSVDCIVIQTGLDGKANMSLGVYDVDGNMVPIGECTALAGDGARIKAGDVVEVTYLYAVDPKKPRLYQVTKPKIRVDKAAAECTLDQLHYTDKTFVA
jgi:ATP-dependent DNA ligase